LRKNVMRVAPEPTLKLTRLRGTWGVVGKKVTWGSNAKAE